MTRPKSQKKPPQKAPLLVFVALESDGYTYSLPPQSEDRLKEAYPEAKPSPRLFLAQDLREDFAVMHQSLTPKILSLLCGLSEEEVRSLGGVSFYSPEKDQVLFTWRVLGSSERTRPGAVKTSSPSRSRPRP